MSSTAVVEVRTAIEKMAPQFKAALPSHVPVERFVRTTLTAVQTNPQLMQADRPRCLQPPPRPRRWA